MKNTVIKDLMVPLAEYATVNEDATLSDAIKALEKAQRAFDHTRYRHRAILVIDKANHPVGKISQIDALRALEPKYKEIQTQNKKSHFRHFSRMFIKSMIDQYQLFDGTLDTLRSQATKIHVKDFMQTLSADDCLDENATLKEAVHLFILGHHQSLLVSSKGRIVGILRLTDVFAAVFQ